MGTDDTGRAAHRAVLAMIAPGTPLRSGLERILAGRTGALIVIGTDAATDRLCDGGFRLDLDFSPTRLRELAKMDGAVLLNADGSRILGANFQLMPDATIPTVESGTRHRTAERVAAQAGHPVIAVSHSMNVISLYHRGIRHEVADPLTILARANQALATLQRYRGRLDEVARALAVAEIEDVAGLRDAATLLQRALMLDRIADELNGHLVELGTDGRLLRLQLDEVLVGTEGLCELLIRDYLPDDAVAPAGSAPVGGQVAGDVLEAAVTATYGRLATLPDRELLDLPLLAREWGFHGATDLLDLHVSPRGYRLLARVPRVPPTVLRRVAGHFGSLQAVLAATAADLRAVEGVGDARARVIREGLSSLVEASLPDRPRRW